jgi:hypothetical protein
MVTDEDAALVRRHNLAFQGEHDNLQPTDCVCRRARVVAAPPRSSGNACHVCGGITVQTGSCTTCTGCGTTGGCG